MEVPPEESGSGIPERQDLLRDSPGKIHEDEVTLMVEVILATLIDDPDQIVLGPFRIRDDAMAA
jgi:hypothetical protein